jgi:hypothetical protein
VQHDIYKRPQRHRHVTHILNITDRRTRQQCRSYVFAWRRHPTRTETLFRRRLYRVRRELSGAFSADRFIVAEFSQKPRQSRECDVITA